MTKPEFTNKRDLTYSKWHRSNKISSRCYATNIDYIEYRYKERQCLIVAIIEEKDFRGTINPSQKEVLLKVADALKVPIYLIKHDCVENPNSPDFWRFEITDMKTDKILHWQITEVEMKAFLENL